MTDAKSARHSFFRFSRLLSLAFFSVLFSPWAHSGQASVELVKLLVSASKNQAEKQNGKQVTNQTDDQTALSKSSMEYTNSELIEYFHLVLTLHHQHLMAGHSIDLENLEELEVKFSQLEARLPPLSEAKFPRLSYKVTAKLFDELRGRDDLLWEEITEEFFPGHQAFVANEELGLFVFLGVAVIYSQTAQAKYQSLMDCGFVAVSESKESFELPLDKALRKWALDNSKDSFVNEIGRYWDMLHDAERFSSDVLRIK